MSISTVSAREATAARTSNVGVDRTQLSWLEQRLSDLIADYDVAEAAFSKLCQRPYPPGLEAELWVLAPGDERRLQLLAEYERISGIQAASDASDAAYERVVAFNHQVLALGSLLPEALRLKAKACLWETPLARLRDESCERVAAFMAQLAAL